MATGLIRLNKQAADDTDVVVPILLVPVHILYEQNGQWDCGYRMLGIFCDKQLLYKSLCLYINMILLP